MEFLHGRTMCEMTWSVSMSKNFDSTGTQELSLNIMEVQWGSTQRNKNTSDNGVQ